jgi:prolipoprotein diacylglyceryltransferase
MERFNTAISVGGVALTWNAIILAASILVAVVVSQILVKKRGAYKDLALDACIVGIPAGLLGGRLFSAISGRIAFSSFFNLGVQGMNLPGALLFAGVGIAVYARIKKLKLSEVFDVLTPGACFGLALGRWSDFFLCDGLGPVVENSGLKFFPLATFTPAYFSDGQTVAYAVFFLDFLVCLGLAIASLILLKKAKPGATARITVIVYLFIGFILEWLRDGATRQIVFGDVRFNQIVLLAALLFFVGLSLYLARQKPETEPCPSDAAEDGDTAVPLAQEEQDADAAPVETPAEETVPDAPPTIPQSASRTAPFAQGSQEGEQPVGADSIRPSEPEQPTEEQP